MKLRKTLAGILGAVVMLLGVGTFEHINRDTGVHAAAVKWQLVEDVSSLTVGDKIVIASNNSTKGTFAAGAISSSYLSSVSVSISSDKKEITSLPSTVLQFTLGGSTGKWTFTNGGKLLGTSATKKVALGSGTTTWGISIGTSGDATISSTNSSYGKILYNIDSPRFTTYTSATSASMLLPQIYKEVPADEAVQSWIASYYNGGVYTKKSEINLNETSEFFELADVIHHDEKQPVSLDRTTYYNGEALFMSNLDGSIGGEGKINSGYKTEGSDLRHFTLNEENKAINDWKVSNITLKKFFVTLDRFMGDGYFDNWTLSATEATYIVNESNKNSNAVKEFVAFVAPCLDNIFESKFSNYFQLDKFTISQSENYYDEPYLSFKIYLKSVCSGTLVKNANLVLSESRIYSGNEVFDENARNVVINAPVEGGKITCDVDISKPVKLDTELTFTIDVDENYELASFKINTSDKLNDALADGQVKWTVKADVTVSLTFNSTLATNDIIFQFGANGAAGHKDGSTDEKTYSETVNGYTLSLTGRTKMYPSSYDAKGNSCIKLGTKSVAGGFTLTVPEDINSVVISAGKFKTNTSKIKINGTTYTLTKNSNDGAYDEIIIDTTNIKEITVITVSGGYRVMINSIEFVK